MIETVLALTHSNCNSTKLKLLLYRSLLFSCLFLYLFRGQALTIYLGCPGTHTVDQNGLELTEIHPFLSLSTGIKGIFHHYRPCIFKEFFQHLIFLKNGNRDESKKQDLNTEYFIVMAAAFSLKFRK